LYNNNENSPIELVAPAGSPMALDAAIGEGADAVYLGLKDFNARLRARNFSYNQFEAAISKLHDMGKKVYVTVNTVFEDWEKDRIFPLLKYFDIVKPDAIIVQDFGLIKLINDNFPSLKVTASTQMNISSSKAVNFLSKYGVKRVVLSRELDFAQLKTIRQNTVSELEVFAHGALCISFSGLCLFSSYFGGKSANRGKCTQACRRLYKSDTQKKGYFFSPSDLMLIEYIPDLIELGINSIKLEGRMKNASYVATIVKAYRNVIDNYQNDKEKAVRESFEILQNDFARNKTKYYFINSNNNDFLNTDASGEIGLFVGKIKEVKKIKGKIMGFIPTKEKLMLNDSVRVHCEEDKRRKSVKIDTLIEEKNGYFIPIPENFKEDDSVYLILRKEELKKYPHIIPNNLSQFKRHPGISKTPIFKKLHSTKKNVHKFNDGIYVKTDNIADIYIFPSIKPEKIIFVLNKRNFELLRKNFASLPFAPKDFILYLNPYFSEESDVLLQEELNFLINKGFNNFIVNNIGQISILKNYDANIIAGPYLYTFNRYSVNFLHDAGCHFFVNPLENNKKNLFEVNEFFDPRLWFVEIFGYPELFQIKADLSKKYDFTDLADNFQNQFHIFANEEQTSIIPEIPFSIIDKIPQLQKNNFNKFIIDLSFMNISKNYYKTIMKAVDNREIIEKFSRFNWKDGFYRETNNENTD